MDMSQRKNIPGITDLSYGVLMKCLAEAKPGA